MARRDLPALVTDIAQLEEINITLPEVSTLLDGVAVGGHTLSDQEIVLNQANSWRKMLADIEAGRFEVSKNYICELHALVAKNEVLTWGEFRSAQVTIAGTQYIPPPASDLDAAWAETIQNFNATEPPFQRAVGLFGDMARNQFFFDGNKRTGRMMMSGFLLSKGLPLLNVRNADKLAFNIAMLSFYESGNKQTLIDFFENYCINEIIARQLQDKILVEKLTQKFKAH